MKKLAASFSALICLSIFLPLTTFAQGTQYDTFNTPNISPDGVIEGKGFIPCSGTTCSPCDLIVLFNTVLKWFLTISFLIFAIVALVAGIKLVTQGNPGALADAKKSFTNAFIGLIIILSAFLIVDTLMRYLVRGGGDIEGYGPWQKVACATQSEATTDNGFFKDSADPEFEQRTISDPAQYGTMEAAATADGTVRFQTVEVRNQFSAASVPLANMLNCMARTMPAGVGQISAITEKAIANGARTMAYCRASGKPACEHVARSLHYGFDGRCGDRSFAVDFGDENNENTICKAANTCGTPSRCVNEGDHVHLSIPVVCN